MNEIMSKKKFPLINKKKQEKKGYQNSGVLTFNRIELIKEHTFLFYSFFLIL